jgi:endonuclease-3
VARKQTPPPPRLNATERQTILSRLGDAYPNPRTELDHETPFQLLIATILSAQSTDKGVNRETPRLFADFPDASALSKASPEQVEPYIARLGLYRNKARAIVAAARQLVELHAGEVPRTREALEALPGVGRKTANVVLSNAFGIPALAVDTHVFRVSRRLGLASADSVEKVEQELMQVIPEALWTDAHHWLILHGRRVCDARKPACAQCVVADVCPSSSTRGIPHSPQGL